MAKSPRQCLERTSPAVALLLTHRVKPLRMSQLHYRHSPNTFAVAGQLLLVLMVIMHPISAFYGSPIPLLQRNVLIASNEDRYLMLIGSKDWKFPLAASARDSNDTDSQSDDKAEKEIIRKLLSRVGRLEEYVAKQEIEIDRLKKQCNDLTEATVSFARAIRLLTDAGLGRPPKAEDIGSTSKEDKAISQPSNMQQPTRTVEALDDPGIFETAPSQIIDAADTAGASILAAMLGGKQRMLVDVRDAELSTNPETLVQFIELAILPVAAGLEGLKSTRNRVKIVFPKVSQLLEYRRTMALAAPEVVALSTLGFDPVEKRDKMVLIVAPSPDDEEGLAAMNELLEPSDPNVQSMQQPVVILNYHMVPVSGLSVEFETAYHLRLLSVQYVSGGDADEFFQEMGKQEEGSLGNPLEDARTSESTDSAANNTIPDEEALEAAMKRAQEVGMNLGVTRAMVIRGYPR